MKHLSFLLMIFIFISCSNSNKEDKSEIMKKELVKSSTIPIHSTEDEFTDDFKIQLKSSLKNVRIVGLGEISHTDGSTFDYKTKLVKYLHEELGFNVIIFEFGFFGNYLIDEKLSRHEDVKVATKYSGWSKSKYGFPTYEYIAKSYSTDTPLHIAGFDGEKVPNGTNDIRMYLKEARDLIDYKISKSDSIMLDSLIMGTYDGFSNPISKRVTKNTIKLSKVIIDSISSKIESQREYLKTKMNPKKYMVYKFALKSILMDVKVNLETEDAGGFLWNSIRDSNMAERTKWLVDSLYSGEKVILWAASSHLARNMISRYRFAKKKSNKYSPRLALNQIGDWLYNYYEEEYYSIAFTTGSGEIGTVYPKGHRLKEYENISSIKKPAKSSFEDIAYSIEANTLFCDLRNVNENFWLHDEFVAYPFGFVKDSIRWKNSVDGLFYIRKMKPDEWRKDLDL